MAGTNMTDQYIITEELLTEFQLQNINLIEFSEKVRSHPYNPQAEHEKYAHEHGWFSDWEMQQAELKGYNKGNADGQDYARKKVLEELEKIKGSFYIIELKRSPEYEEIYKKIVNLIVELRQKGKVEK